MVVAAWAVLGGRSPVAVASVTVPAPPRKPRRLKPLKGAGFCWFWSCRLPSCCMRPPDEGWWGAGGFCRPWPCMELDGGHPSSRRDDVTGRSAGHGTRSATSPVCRWPQFSQSAMTLSTLSTLFRKVRRDGNNREARVCRGQPTSQGYRREHERGFDGRRAVSHASRSKVPTHCMAHPTPHRYRRLPPPGFRGAAEPFRRARPAVAGERAGEAADGVGERIRVVEVRQV